MESGTEVKRWTAKRKRQVVLDILKGKATVAEVARQHDLTPSQVEGWIEEGLAAMENGLRARPVKDWPVARFPPKDYSLASWPFEPSFSISTTFAASRKIAEDSGPNMSRPSLALVQAT